MTSAAPYLLVYRLAYQSPLFVGVIDTIAPSFSYDEGYRADKAASHLSFSLPLSARQYGEEQFRPYFEGLLPEAKARQVLAASIGVQENDYLALLQLCGKDCIGDTVILGASSSDAAAAQEAIRPLIEAHAYAPMKRDALCAIFSDSPSIALENAESSLSLAGAQDKTGLAHLPDAKMEEGWSRPLGLAASTHILKRASLAGLAELEYLCMTAARACGIRTARTDILDLCGPIVCSERFDRAVRIQGEALLVQRLHQEDFAQIFGILPTSKYAELSGGSVARIASHIRTYSERPPEDLRQFAAVLCYCYLIGNCDNHLKNTSVLYRGDSELLRLAPAYDLVGTTYFAGFSRQMGMDFDGARTIDEIGPSHLAHVANSLGMRSAALRGICGKLAAETVPALREAAKRIEASFPLAPYIVDDLEEDMAPRLEVMRAFAHGIAGRA